MALARGHQVVGVSAPLYAATQATTGEPLPDRTQRFIAKVHAWSSASLKRLSEAWLDGRRRFVQLRSEHQWVGHAWARVRSRT